MSPDSDRRTQPPDTTHTAEARQLRDSEPDGSGDPDSTKAPQRGPIIVRNTRQEDFTGIVELSKVVYPDDPWTADYLASHLRVFPEGQLVAVDTRTGEVVGMAASLLIRWADYGRHDNYARMTDRFWFTNHDPAGDTLYGAEVMVDPRRRRQGIGSKLYQARRDLAWRFRVERILAGARLPGYAKHAAEMSAEEYVQRVIRGELHDSTLSFQIGRGFRVVSVVPGYARGDEPSRGYAALIEWPTGYTARRRSRDRASQRSRVSTAA